jgi:hypothetical protein
MQRACADAAGCDPIRPCSSPWSQMAGLHPPHCSERAGVRGSGYARTFANLGALPPAVIDGLRVLLAGARRWRGPRRSSKSNARCKAGYADIGITCLGTGDPSRTHERKKSPGPSLAVEEPSGETLAAAVRWAYRGVQFSVQRNPLEVHWLPSIEAPQKCDALELRREIMVVAYDRCAPTCGIKQTSPIVRCAIAGG